MFCCALLYVHSSIAIILMGKRELIALLNLSSWCLVMVERLFLAVPRGCLQFVIVVFPDHTHYFCPDYLASLVPATVGSVSTYPLRNSSDLQTLHTNSRLYYTSFLPSAVRDWNELPEQTRNSPSLNIFKNRLNPNLITPPRYYNTGKRLGQIYHARLRTACSPLRQHLH